MKCDASGVHPDPEKVSSGSTQHGNTHQQEGTADAAVPQLGSSSTGRLSNQPLRNHLCYVTSRRKTCPSCGRAITKPAWTESNKQSQKSLRWDTDNTGLHSRQTPASLGSRPELALFKMANPPIMLRRHSLMQKDTTAFLKQLALTVEHRLNLASLMQWILIALLSF